MSNSQCSVDANSSSVSGSYEVFTLRLAVSFAPSFAGNKIVYVAGRDHLEHNSGWQAVGGWKVSGGGSSSPAVVSVSPAHIGNTAQSLVTFTVSDDAGYADLGITNVLINNYLAGTPAILHTPGHSTLCT